MSKIRHIHARQIFDSRGYPTIEVDVKTTKGILGTASVPSGISTGLHEALELRDENPGKYDGKGVQKAINNINYTIAKALIGYTVFDQISIDQLLINLDGTENKSNLGANALLAVSLAIAKAAAREKKKSLYRYLALTKQNTYMLPVPMMNILNGGAHANNLFDLQEFMIMPMCADSFSEAFRMGVETFYQLYTILQKKGLSTNVGDEGGFAPHIATHETGIEYILQAIEQAGYRPGEDIFIALDAAATELYDAKNQLYHFKKSTGQKFTSNELIAYWKELVSKYPIVSIEDAMSEDDWTGWQQLTKILSSKIQLVGDDLFVTNVARLQKGIEQNIANAILIKVNQIGTLTEAIAAINLAKRYHYRQIISHRSGETEDHIIADLAVAFSTEQIKAGGASRSERMAKYNQLLRIEEELGNNACYSGIKLFS